MQTTELLIYVLEYCIARQMFWQNITDCEVIIFHLCSFKPGIYCDKPLIFKVYIDNEKLCRVVWCNMLQYVLFLGHPNWQEIVLMPERTILLTPSGVFRFTVQLAKTYLPKLRAIYFFFFYTKCLH